MLSSFSLTFDVDLQLPCSVQALFRSLQGPAPAGMRLHLCSKDPSSRGKSFFLNLHSPCFIRPFVSDVWHERQGEREGKTCNKGPRLDSNPGLCGKASAYMRYTDIQSSTRASPGSFNYSKIADIWRSSVWSLGHPNSFSWAHGRKPDRKSCPCVWHWNTFVNVTPASFTTLIQDEQHIPVINSMPDRRDVRRWQ